MRDKREKKKKGGMDDNRGRGGFASGCDRKASMCKRENKASGGRNRAGTRIKNWQVRAGGCGSMLLLLPCNRSRSKVAERSRRQKRMMFIVQ
jgi:hypothetical protein